MKKKKDEDTWIVSEGQEEGLPMIYRMRDIIPSAINTPEYPNLISVLWEYDFDNPSGMPSDELDKQQRAFEDALDKMDNTGIGIMMLAVTGNGRREWVWYVNDQSFWLSSMHSCLEGHPTYPIDIEKSDDPHWDTWKTFRQGAK